MIVRKLVEITGADTCKEVNPLGEEPKQRSFMKGMYDYQGVERFKTSLMHWHAAEAARQEYKITNEPVNEGLEGVFAFIVNADIKYISIDQKIQADCNEETKTCTIA